MHCDGSLKGLGIPSPSHSYNTFICRLSPRFLSISSSLVSSVGRTTLGCQAENRTRACLTAKPTHYHLRYAAPSICATPYSLEHSMGARNRVGIGSSYLPARLHRLAEFIRCNRFLGSLKVLKITSQDLKVDSHVLPELAFLDEPVAWRIITTLA